VVAGIDVGGRAKGYHGVALKDGAYFGQYASKVAKDVAQWCQDVSARIVAIDAPSAWSINGRARTAERELMREGIGIFSTPTLQCAKDHPRDYYGWMLAGAELYSYVQPTHPLWQLPKEMPQGTFSFETFPHAVACKLSGRIVTARRKSQTRRDILTTAGCQVDVLKNIDSVDAALCALTAHFVATDQCTTYGDPATGLIVLPLIG